MSNSSNPMISSLSLPLSTEHHKTTRQCVAVYEHFRKVILPNIDDYLRLMNESMDWKKHFPKPNPLEHDLMELKRRRPRAYINKSLPKKPAFTSIELARLVPKNPHIYNYMNKQEKSKLSQTLDEQRINQLFNEPNAPLAKSNNSWIST